MRHTLKLLSRLAKDHGKGEQEIKGVVDFLRLDNRLASVRGNAGSFSRFLGLGTSPTPDENNHSTYNNVQEKDLSFVKTGVPPDVPSLVYRYHLPNTLKYLNSAGDDDEDTAKILLSTYTAILDDVSTWSMVLATLRNPRPGVSVSMQTEWGPASAASPSLLGPPGDRAVDIVTTMSKRGQTMAFLRSEVRDPRSGEAICHFMHTKFLDPGPIFRLLLTPQGRWLLEFLSQNVLPLFTKTKATRSGKEDEDTNDAKTKGILDSFKITGDTSASFRVTSQHSNGFGGLHGGVQAVLMENLGRRVAKKVLSLERQQSLDPRCEKILVTYQSSASKQLKLSAFVMNSNPTEQRTTVRVVIERDNPKQKGPALLVSEGVLDFVVPTTHG